MLNLYSFQQPERRRGRRPNRICTVCSITCRHDREIYTTKCSELYPISKSTLYTERGISSLTSCPWSGHFRCLPDSAQKENIWAEIAGQLGYIPNLSQSNPSLWADAPPWSVLFLIPYLKDPSRTATSSLSRAASPSRRCPCLRGTACTWGWARGGGTSTRETENPSSALWGWPCLSWHVGKVGNGDWLSRLKSDDPMYKSLAGVDRSRDLSRVDS